MGTKILEIFFQEHFSFLGFVRNLSEPLCSVAPKDWISLQ
jgi:hypothetical protein